jgi:hypothetical protein
VPSNLHNIVDNYLPHFTKTPINNIKPNLIKGFDDVNMQHILDKHSMAHFDFVVNGVARDIDFFPAGTSQQDVADWIDQCLATLNPKGSTNLLPAAKFAETVSCNGMTFILGSDSGKNIQNGVFPDNQMIIGQFYPVQGATRIKPNSLKTLKQLLT